MGTACMLVQLVKYFTNSNTNSSSVLVWMLLALTIAVKGSFATEESDKICRSVDVRNEADALKRLSGCRVVEGFVRVVLIDRANETDYDNFTFPDLHEITDYLLVYRVTGLTSLGSLFPNLTVIRGNSLFVNYALVVYEMFQLKELGLGSLTTILRGSVRVEKNRQLCYLYSVNWKSIMRNGELYAVNNNPESVLCPSCPTSCDGPFCWGRQTCQKLNNVENYNCHELCLGGCVGPGPDQCYACTHVVNDGVCLEKCPPDRYEFMGRRCVTENECQSSEVPPAYLQRSLLPGLPSKAWIPYNGSCCLMCPPNYQPSIRNDNKYTCEPCIGYCRKVCGIGEQTPIESIYHIQQLNGCTYVNGSLIIRLLTGTQYIEELIENFDGIEEISGFLKIFHSYPLTSLNFFKRLRVIHGMELESDQFAFVLVQNDNLQELWNWNTRPRNFTIHRGTLSIHSNPQLCMSVIDEFRTIAGFHNDSTVEISHESNGNNIACKPIKMNATSAVINSTSVQIEWKPFEGKKSVLGYTVHYKESHNNNVTLREDSDECEDDNWRVAYVVVNSQTAINITRLKPFTEYAFYVKTYSSAFATFGGRSPIQYFRTFPDRPSIPRYLRAYSNSSSEIVLYWQPPLFPNGEISHYIIVGWKHYDDEKLLDQRDYCQVPLKPQKEETEEQPILNKPQPQDSCCKQVSPGTCISNDDPRFNFIYTQEAVNEEPDSCDQETSIYSVLYSHRLYGNGGGIQDMLDLADGHFIQTTEGNSTTTTLRELYHFAEYTIKVVACRRNRYGEIDFKWNDRRCSPASLITTRTKRLPTADLIDSSFVRVSVESNTARVFWMEPPNPNGVIVSYHVEYRRIDIAHFKPVTICVSKSQFEKSKNWYDLNSLPPGEYALRLKATSLAGDSTFTECIEFTVKPEAADESFHSDIIVLAVVVVSLLTLLFGITFCLWKKMKTESETAREIPTELNPDYISLAVYEPDEWEIVRDKVEILKELSHGSFGIVYEGILYPANIHCAVKTVDEKATIRERVEFLNEASVMKSFAGGHHVVRLFGVVSRGQPPLVVMELLALGDLKTFLRNARTESPFPITLARVLLMAAQIADGMAYLEASKFVHRDLAARNCMLSEDATVKIGDFGMTRDIYHTDYYRKGNKGLLPVRWMAPESLADGVFTNQSDVWSYGIVLWEIATFAEQPYQGLSNEQVLQYVLKGEFLEKPINCPEILYNLMLACWQKRPAHRPTFLRLVRVLDAVTDVGEDFRQNSFYHSQSGQELRLGWCQTNKSSPSGSSSEYVNSDTSEYVNSNICEIIERLNPTLDGEGIELNVFEERTKSSVQVNKRPVSEKISSGSFDINYLTMSTRASLTFADEYVLGDSGS